MAITYAHRRPGTDYFADMGIAVSRRSEAITSRELELTRIADAQRLEERRHRH